MSLAIAVPFRRLLGSRFAECAGGDNINLMLLVFFKLQHYLTFTSKE